MRPCAGGGHVDDVAGGEEARPANGDAADVVAVDAGPLELLWFATDRMHDHGAWVRAIENAHEQAEHDFDEMRCAVLESLLVVSHVAHCYLRHRDAGVREAAETLTTGAANLIGRIYHRVAARLYRAERMR